MPRFPFCFGQQEASVRLSFYPMERLFFVLLSSYILSLVQMAFPFLSTPCFVF